MNASTLGSGIGHTGAGSSAGAFLPTQRTPVHEFVSELTSVVVLIIDPDTVAAEALATGLREIGVGSVLMASTPEDVDELLDSGVAGNLALISLALGRACTALIPRLRGGGWQRVLALSPIAEIGPVIDAVGAGANGVLVGQRLSTSIVDVPQAVHELSAREIEVIRLVADGRSNKWIGDRLSLSALTVKSHLARIGRKLGTGDRAQMVALALRAGVIS